MALVIAIDLPLRRLSHLWWGNLLAIHRHSMISSGVWREIPRPGAKLNCLKLQAPLIRLAILNLFSAPRSFRTTRSASKQTRWRLKNGWDDQDGSMSCPWSYYQSVLSKKIHDRFLSLACYRHSEQTISISRFSVHLLLRGRSSARAWTGKGGIFF